MYGCRGKNPVNPFVDPGQMSIRRAELSINMLYAGLPPLSSGLAACTLPELV
jgi:hypothetical protein